MKIIRGNKLIEISKDSLLEMLKPYPEVTIDIGTGDGRFIYKNAISTPNAFFIGVDPSQTQLAIYSKRSARERSVNALYVLGSIEIFPEELYRLADHVKIILPWGSLLQALVSPRIEEISKLYKLLKDIGDLEMVFGYSQEAEPSEVERLQLNKLDLDYLRETVVPMFIEVGFTSATLSNLEKSELNNFESTWSKKLRFGQDRPLFHLKLNKTS